MEIKNLKKAAQRIKKAVNKGENIIIYGDTDLDGTASVIMLKECIGSLGGKVSLVYFPNREKEGYGLNERALLSFKKYLPALLITLDLGIGNVKEVKLAKELGFKTIIVDHHEILEEMPKADIIVDPKQKGDKYHFKGFATAGLAFKLVSCILGEKLKNNLKKNFLELTALATIADMMPQIGENKEFIDEGISCLKDSWRPGIKAFMNIKEVKELKDANLKISKIISVLNVRDVSCDLPASYRLLTVRTEKEAGELIKRFLKKNLIRKRKIEKTLKKVENKIFKKEERIIFEGGKIFDTVSMSAVASILCRRNSKPVFIFKKMAKESLGTVRSPSGVDSVSLMKKCSRYLITYGGHPQASGFRLKNEDLKSFKQCLLDNF